MRFYGHAHTSSTLHNPALCSLWALYEAKWGKRRKSVH
jgi:hypothetical protein